MNTLAFDIICFTVIIVIFFNHIIIRTLKIRLKAWCTCTVSGWYHFRRAPECAIPWPMGPISNHATKSYAGATKRVEKVWTSATSGKVSLEPCSTSFQAREHPANTWNLGQIGQRTLKLQQLPVSWWTMRHHGNGVRWKHRGLKTFLTTY